MSKRLQKVCSVLCALTLLLGCVALGAAAEETEGMEVNVVSLEWDDANNQDGLRPDSVKAALYAGDARVGEVTLNEENNWTNLLVLSAANGNSGAQWRVTGIPEGYAVKIGKEKNGTTVVTAGYQPAGAAVSAKAVWQGDENAKSLRPKEVIAQLLADGQYYADAKLNEANGWAAEWQNLPKLKNENGKAQAIAYTVSFRDVRGYTAQQNGNTKVYSLETGKLTVSRQVEGAPAGADLSKLTYEISGPDDRLPVTVSGASYMLEGVPAGAYLVKEKYAEGVIPGYTLDAADSVLVGSAAVKAGSEGSVTLKNVFVEAGEETPGTEKAAEAPSADELAKLTFRIDGPDPSMPVTVTYGDFVNGEYSLSDIVPGVYTVIELNAGKIVNGYTLDLADSTLGGSVTVGDGAAVIALHNAYLKNTPIPPPTAEPTEEPTATPEVTPEPTPEVTEAPTPEVTEEPTPEPTEEPTPEPTEGPTEEPTPVPPVYINVPVVKNWVDSDNRDGNRPESVTVRLLGNGAEVAAASLSAGNNWSCVFENLLKTDAEGNDIAYTVTEDEVPLYQAAVSGTVITNIYTPELTSATVKKVWSDNGNSAKLRPGSIYAVLSNGSRDVATVILNEQNGWTATVNNLPTVVNGAPVTYTWREQEVLGYRQTGNTVEGSVTTFTNTLYARPNKPNSPGTPYLIIEEYGTPLGVEIVINHVGDCFD